MSNAFDFDTRVLTCKNCAAPIQAESLSGGAVTCSYCGAAHEVVSRKLDPVAPLTESAEVDEAQRLAMLRTQDEEVIDAPDAIQPLLHNYQIAPWKIEEAVALWQSSRAQLEQRDDYQAAEILYNLTMLLSNHYLTQDDSLRARALNESVLDVLTLPRHLQAVYCWLARNAARNGDLEAAEHWLAPCNRRATDLEMDSTYRMARATIATARGDYRAVLDILGVDVNSVPIASTMIGLAAVMRANALEQTGEVEKGSQQLILYMLANESNGRYTLERIIEGFEADGTRVCTRSFQLSTAVVTEQKAEAAGSAASGGGIGPIFTLFGGLLSAGSIAVILAVLLADLFGEDGYIAIIVFVCLGVGGLLMLIIGLAGLKSTARVKRLYREGVPTPAKVESCTPTGIVIDGALQYEVEVQLTGSTGNVYKVKTEAMLRSALIPGTGITVRVDPVNPTSVLLGPTEK